MNRNSMCSCGSGRRYKHCCGNSADPAPQARDEALAAHRAGSLGRAEALYRRALDEHPQDIDSLHMLGVVQLQRLRYREALALLWDAAEKTGWSVPQIRHNLGLTLGKLVTRDANARQADLLTEFVALEQARRNSRANVATLVTVVLPAYNHSRYVAQAIASVGAQTYPHIELVAIDDGSDDGTATAIAASLTGFRFPARFVTRENRGAPATLNEGAALARGQYLAFLNSDDHYAPDRIATLVRDIAGAGVPWGFSLVARSGADVNHSEQGIPDIILQKQRNFLGTQPTSFTLVEYNVAVSSGNLFVEREFFQSLGGFRDYRYNHDWDFCLRAASIAEPAVVNRPLYFYRIHESNTIGESRERATEDADRVLGDFLATTLASAGPARNAIGPQSPDNRALLLKLVFRAGQGGLVPIPLLRSLAVEWLVTRPPAITAPTAPSATGRDSAPKCALVVLGMHRSGTSAMARVLNLCGAFLPERLKPPKIGVNPKGFWETEAVLDLNVRVIRQLGGEWDRIEFTLPGAGEIVDEFVSDARALLVSEYDDQAMILIKDPRMCVLAPLWHRALVTAGYRPVYLVPVRNPIEVARSLHARGDMTVNQGLALWSTYMTRVDDFGRSCADITYVRFVDLLDDWRSVIARIAARFGVPLTPGNRADEVDRFLEHGLRTHAAGAEALDALSADPAIAGVRAQYRALLARCDADAVTGHARISAVEWGTVGAAHAEMTGTGGTPRTLGFVLCIENNAIRDQALLLCESIRRYGGRFRQCPIMAFAPRAGLGVDRATRAALEALDVEYVDKPLNTECLDYPPANRVFAGSYAEAYSSVDYLAVLDSDTLWLDEPELPWDADAAIRPIDVKGSATRGHGDRFEAYWAAMAKLCGIDLDRLPLLRSTIGNERIRASYNAGLAVVRRRRGILTCCAELFSASLKAGLKPYKGAGVNIYASTGYVGIAGSELWGSSQAALSLAIWANSDRVLHYPDHYNVPLHLLAADGDVHPRWMIRPPTHLHYHWMFGRQHQEIAMELLTKLGVSADRLAWLESRTPLRYPDDHQAHARATAG